MTVAVRSENHARLKTDAGVELPVGGAQEGDIPLNFQAVAADVHVPADGVFAGRRLRSHRAIGSKRSDAEHPFDLRGHKHPNLQELSKLADDPLRATGVTDVGFSSDGEAPPAERPLQYGLANARPRDEIIRLCGVEREHPPRVVGAG